MSNSTNTSTKSVVANTIGGAITVSGLGTIGGSVGLAAIVPTAPVVLPVVAACAVGYGAAKVLNWLFD